MNSSTSSSDPVAPAVSGAAGGSGDPGLPTARLLRVLLLALLCLLLLAELGLRHYEARLSADVAQRAELRARLAALPEQGPPLLLFLGNSLTRAGVDAAQVAAGLAAQGRVVDVEVAHRNDTTLAEWRAMYAALAQEAGRTPRWVVVGYADRHLVDVSPADPTLLGADYASLADLRWLVGAELRSVSAVVEFALADRLRLFAHRYRLRRRLLHALIPAFPALAERLYVRAPGPTAPADAAGDGRLAPLARERLQALAARTRADGAQPLVVAMPTRAGYVLPRALVTELDALGVTLLDARALPLGAADFNDAHHLSASGRASYGAWLAARLPTVLQD